MQDPGPAHLPESSQLAGRSVQHQAASSTRRLLSDGLRIPVEQRVSAYLGRRWQVTEVQGRAESASHAVAILSDGGDSVFVKLGQGPVARQQLTQELAGLRLLSERSGVRTPAVIGIVETEGGTLAVMEAVQEVKRERRHWRQMGQALARIHRVKADRYGLETDCYWGDLYQDNSPLDDWPAFFWQRRLAPRLRAALDSGRLPRDVALQVERLHSRLPDLCGPEVEPSLLHGDAHQNNFLNSAEGPVLIDPAVYYGHPEIDLAYVDFFSPVSDQLLQAYAEMAPLDAGFEERRDLWRIPAWLAMVQVDGTQHLDALRVAVGRYA